MSVSSLNCTLWHIILNKCYCLLNKPLEMHHLIFTRVLMFHKYITTEVKHCLHMFIFSWGIWVATVIFVPIIDSCTSCSFALFLALVGTLSASSHRAAATYQFGSTFYLCRWYLAPMRLRVAAVVLSTCQDIILPEDSMSVVFPTHHHNTVCCVQYFSSGQDTRCKEGFLCFSLPHWGREHVSFIVLLSFLQYHASFLFLYLAMLLSFCVCVSFCGYVVVEEE